MRKLVYLVLTSMAVALVGCVTINVYFPEAAAQKAADQFIGNVLDDAGQTTAPKKSQPEPADTKGQRPSAMLLDLLIPAAHAADTPDIRIHTSATDALRERMRARFHDSLEGLLDSGAAGFTHDGLVALHDAASLPLSQRSQASATVAAENRDRNELYREIAQANNHPEWQSKIRDTFAKGWIDKAHSGWYYQNAGGKWVKK